MKKTSISKREILEMFAGKGNCDSVSCENCPYFNKDKKACKVNSENRLLQIGAKAILRMFPEKKEPLLIPGTIIKFSTGEICRLEFYTSDKTFEPKSYLRELNTNKVLPIETLVCRYWKILTPNGKSYQDYLGNIGRREYEMLLKSRF